MSNVKNEDIEKDKTDPRAAPHAFSPETVLMALGTSVLDGLTDIEVASRLAKYGPNVLQVQRQNSFRQFVTSQISSVVVWLLAVAALIAILVGDNLEAYSILAVLALNAGIGFAIEWQAGKALEALRTTTKAIARVRRNGSEKLVDASELVSGDIVVLTAGDRVPADARTIDAVNLRADESTLTGESMPVDKRVTEVPIETPLAERTPMLFLGTNIVAGHGTAVVTSLAADTEIGRIGTLVSRARVSQTPLERRLANLGKRLVYAVLAIAAVVFAAGALRGDGIWLMMEVAISLAVAAVPEGLPTVTTLILAIGVLRMARRNAIVRRLSAVETLGSSTVICSDKTGTLTENRMTVREFFVAGFGKFELGMEAADLPVQPIPSNRLQRLLLVGVLCNEAAASTDETGKAQEIGDPTEAALLTAALRFGLVPGLERAKYPVVHEEPFTSATKRMTVILEQADKTWIAALKGAPSVVMDSCTSFIDENGTSRKLDKEARSRFLEINRDMAGRALRVLAFAEKEVVPCLDPAEISDGEFVFLGFAGINDPIRQGATEAVQRAQNAGIRVVMLTGDQLHTAHAIARDLRLAGDSEILALHSSDLAGENSARISKLAREANVFARVTPEDKLRIVRALQEAGEIVAVTGDGVNDAPALKQADIGVAMGLRGTEVAKESSDIVLTDDNFTTIVEAIRGGRTIYANILKFVHLMFSQNLAEVLVIFVAIIAGMPLPLLPLQILWINLVTDVFPALALAVEPPSPNVLKRRPFPPQKSMLPANFVFLIVWQGILLASIALAAYIWALTMYGAGIHARTVAVMAVIGVQLGHLLNCRSRSRSAFDGFLGNPYIFAAAAIVLVLQAFALYFPPLQNILKTVPPEVPDLVVIGMTVILPIVIVEFTKFLSRQSRKDANNSG